MMLMAIAEVCAQFIITFLVVGATIVVSRWIFKLVYFLWNEAA